MSTLDPAVYRRAADVIRLGGLGKGAYKDQAKHCLVGALRVARSVDPQFGTYIADKPWTVPLAEMLGLPIADAFHTISHVVEWNDRPQTTEQDVITLLEQAAEKLEADW